ncbi:MAG: aldose 1-epimerase [Phycisphaeraceae bacterium]|nr:MAG: aldose 1-epimerase [Phycisphaeraceae bacterium]
MTRLALHAGPLHAEIDPGVGASITDFSIDGPALDRYPLLRRAPGVLDDPAHAACFLLAPWSNRVAGARFAFEGKEHGLRANFADGTAIHGDVCARPWKIIDRTPISARLVFDSREYKGVNFPWSFASVVRYELSPDALSVELSVTNVSDEPFPAGCGLHPFFARRIFSERDKVELRAPVAGLYPGEDQIPTGPHRPDEVSERLTAGGPLGNVRLDDCFGGFAGRAEVVWPASGVRLTMDCSDAMTHLITYTPQHEGQPMPWFCVEPVTNANDGFNLHARGIDAGVRVLAPGETLNTTTTFHVRTE